MENNEQKKTPNIYDWLEHVRIRPLMYVRKKDDLLELESMIHGYYNALHHYAIDQQVPALDHLFARWLYQKKKWSASQGWAKAIYHHLPENTSAFDMFFSLIDEYKKLQPKALAQATPKGLRTEGFPPCPYKELPEQIIIIQYDPDPFFFLRQVFASHFWDDSTVFSTHEWFIRHAKHEFLVEPDDWMWLT